MEASLLVRCECQNPEQRDVIILFLTKGKRPDFEEEVEEKFHPIFDALEFTEYPQTRKKLGKKSLRVAWHLGGFNIDSDTKDILTELEEAGVVDVFAYLSGDDVDLFLTLSEGKLQRVSQWNTDDLDEIRGDVNKEFKYLDQVRSSYLEASQ